MRGVTGETDMEQRWGYGEEMGISLGEQKKKGVGELEDGGT